MTSKPNRSRSVYAAVAAGPIGLTNGARTRPNWPATPCQNRRLECLAEPRLNPRPELPFLRRRTLPPRKRPARAQQPGMPAPPSPLTFDFCETRSYADFIRALRQRRRPSAPSTNAAIPLSASEEGSGTPVSPAASKAPLLSYA
jgi:hypothetical protein